jgi:competence protein ComEA
MKPSTVKTALIAAALLLSANLSFAADSKPEAAATPKASASSAQVKKAPAANVKLIDINSASKAELMKLPGISAADADKIIAGRPYLTKAHLVTHNIISAPVYHNLKTMIIAKQKNTAKPKK